MRQGRKAWMESLESRTLLSASLASPWVQTEAPSAAASVVTVGKNGIGDTLKLTAGVAFSGEVAFLQSPVLDPPGSYSATINWGDGSTTTATVQYGTDNGASGYQFLGTHTYAKAGTYKTTTTVLEKLSIGPVAGPTGTPIILVASISGKAIVAPANSSGGVTLHETTGQAFTASVGTFVALAPATHLVATITWGDGKTSAGTVISTGVAGLDTINFEVSGSHTYAASGMYGITVKVTKPGVSATAVGTTVATINSTAIVTAPQHLSLAGTLTGTYTRPLVPVDVGQVYSFKGSGTAGALGAVTVTGTIGLPGFIVASTVTGALTLVNAQGSVDLSVSAPFSAGMASLPSTFSYTISSGTGIYAGSAGSGTLTVTLTPSTSASGKNMFKFVLS